MKFEFLDKVVDEFKKINGVKSIYLYGSILGKNFDPKKSDIDFLIIAKEDNPLKVIVEFKKAKKKFNKIKIDLNICFVSEFERRIHVYRPPTYFIGIAKKSKLLFGKDLLKGVKDSEVTLEKLFERAANLSQSARAAYLNEKDLEFWTTKLRKWIVVCFLEALFAEGVFELDLKIGLKKFVKKAGAPAKILDILDPKKTTLKSLLKTIEWLRQYLLKKTRFSG